MSHDGRPAPHPFAEDPDTPGDPVSGKRVCRCGLVGRPGDAHHNLPAVPAQAEARRRAGDRDD